MKQLLLPILLHVVLFVPETHVEQPYSALSSSTKDISHLPNEFTGKLR